MIQVGEKWCSTDVRPRLFIRLQRCLSVVNFAELGYDNSSLCLNAAKGVADLRLMTVNVCMQRRKFIKLIGGAGLSLDSLLGQGVGAKDLAAAHGTVFRQAGRFAAWPANHGIWRWENEVLVGFQVAPYQDKPGHPWDSSRSLHQFARTSDGGRSWEIEDALAAGISGLATGHRPDDPQKPVTGPADKMDFMAAGFGLTFRRRTDKVGPSMFYTTTDRGRSWQGPWKFPNFDTAGVATRTEYLINSADEMLVFLTTAKPNGMPGHACCAKTSDGGLTWQKLSWIENSTAGQAIMPAAVRCRDASILVALRRHTAKGDPHPRSFISIHRSRDDGRTWEAEGEAATKLGWNSNPPSLLRLNDGRICLAYARRASHRDRASMSSIDLRLSEDDGRTWSKEITVRDGDGADRDIGYTRITQLPNGELLLIYYYNHARASPPARERYIACSRILL